MADEQTREYYRQRAPEYEQIYYRDNPPRRKEIDDEAAFLRAFAGDQEVIELACGTGYWTKVVAQTARSVVATDLSPEMIAQAQLKEYDKEPLFVVGNLEHPPVPAGSFDLLVLGFWLSHQPKETYPLFFDTISQPLRPGGAIWMIDNNPPAEGSTVDSVRVDEHGNNYKQRRLNNGESYIILKNYFERGELVAIVEPYFHLERLVYGMYYWSMVLRPKGLL